MSVDYKLLKNYSTSAKKTEYRAVIVENGGAFEDVRNGVERYWIDLE